MENNNQNCINSECGKYSHSLEISATFVGILLTQLCDNGLRHNKPFCGNKLRGLFMLLSIDLLPYQDRLLLHHDVTGTYLTCLIRKKRLVVTPEEIVRQLLLHCLIEEYGYPQNRIRVEMGLKVNTMSRRCDILVFNRHVEPVFLVECKSAKVKISQRTFEQIAAYNTTLKVPYLLVSNGPVNYCAHIDHQERNFEFLPEVPHYEALHETMGVGNYTIY